MLNDNTTLYNGYQALGNIQVFVQKGNINDASKLQTMVDGLANYLKNPGEINFTSIFADNDNMRVLSGMIEVVLPEFLKTYNTEIKEKKIHLTLLADSLQILDRSVPDDKLAESFKSRVASVYKDLQLI